MYVLYVLEVKINPSRKPKGNPVFKLNEWTEWSGDKNGKLVCFDVILVFAYLKKTTTKEEWGEETLKEERGESEESRVVRCSWNWKRFWMKCRGQLDWTEEGSFWSN